MHALSLPTWWIHLASVLEWGLAMLAIQRWGRRRGERAWSWLALAMLPALVSAMAACTWHLFDNAEALKGLVVFQAGTTALGNVTLALAAWNLARQAVMQQALAGPAVLPQALAQQAVAEQAVAQQSAAGSDGPGRSGHTDRSA